LNLIDFFFRKTKRKGVFSYLLIHKAKLIKSLENSELYVDAERFAPVVGYLVGMLPVRP